MLVYVEDICLGIRRKLSKKRLNAEDYISGYVKTHLSALNPQMTQRAKGA